MSANDFMTGRSLALPSCQFCYWPNYHQPIMLKIRLAWLWWHCAWHVLPWLHVIWLVNLTFERHKREFFPATFQNNRTGERRWSWISNCGEAFHTDCWLAEANPGQWPRRDFAASFARAKYGSTIWPWQSEDGRLQRCEEMAEGCSRKVSPLCELLLQLPHDVLA